MEKLRREIVFVSPEYTGSYICWRGMGQLKRNDPGRVDEWIKENSIGRSGNYLGRNGNLIFDGNALCNVHIGAINLNPEKPGNEQEVKYNVRVRVVVSPRDAQIPAGLVKSLEGYSQEE
jgi:hypothetical protein